MRFVTTYALGCDLLGANGNDYLVVRIRDLKGLLDAPIVRDHLGPYAGLAKLGVTVAPGTASAALYSPSVQEQIDKALRENGLSKFIDARFATTTPTDTKLPTEFVNGAVVGGVATLILAGLGLVVAKLAQRKG